MKHALLVPRTLEALVATIRKTADLYAPARDVLKAGTGERSGTPDDRAFTAFRNVDSASDIVLTGTNTRLSAKGVFFPQREVLLSFRGAAMSEAPVPPHDATLGETPALAEIAARSRGLVLFGVRPCDARALTMLDKVFAGTAAGPGNSVHEDPYYLRRRRNSLVISLACENPCESCFCTSVGGSPFGTAGTDILASRTKGGVEGAALLLEAITPAGAVFLSEHAALFAPATDEMLRARDAKAASVSAGMKRLDFRGVKDRADAAFTSPVWDEISRTCLGCGACTYLCPTCHCFDITDETRGASGVRVRSWDACQYSLFTAHASGHNPRPQRTARMRQRVMHKYSYAVETAGEVFCTGCGRCVRHCPVNLDIREMLLSLKDRL